MPLKLPRLPANQQLINADGTPTIVLSRWWQSMAEQIEASINGIQAALDAAAAANAAADAANAAADTAQGAADDAQAATDAAKEEQSLINSYVANFTGTSVLSSDTSGNVTIVNHDRVYGDSTLNPTVSVTGSVVASGQAAGTIVRIYYDDPFRAGGAVSYQWTTDASVAAQGGIRHSVGAVEVPATGTSDGGFVQPPGYSSKFPDY